MNKSVLIVDPSGGCDFLKDETELLVLLYCIRVWLVVFVVLYTRKNDDADEVIVWEFENKYARADSRLLHRI